MSMSTTCDGVLEFSVGDVGLHYSQDLVNSGESCSH